MQGKAGPQAAPNRRRKPFAATAATGAALGLQALALSSEARAQDLGTAADFGVLAASTVTNTGSSVIMGSVGVSPGGAIVGFPPGIVVAPGTFHSADGVAGQAQIDANNAWVTLMGLPSQVDLTGQNLGGLVLPPAVYSFSSSAQLTGVLTLNGLGNTAAQWVFQIGSDLTTASNSAVLLINGANGNNVFWAVGSSATLGTDSVFAGNIIALTSITLTTGASLTCGRALALNGAVTLDSNTITLCVAGVGGVGGDITSNDLFGEGVTGAQQAAFAAAGLFGSAVMSEAAFGSDGPGEGQNPAQDQNGNSLKDGPLQGGPGGSYTDASRPDRLRFWARGFGGRGSLDGDAASGSAGVDSRVAGVAMGVDARVDRTTLAGLVVGYTQSGFSVDERLTNGSAEGMHVGIYGVKRLGPVYLAAAADYAHFSNDTDRFIDWVVDERARGEFDSDMFSARFETGWRLYAGRHRVTPFAGAQVSHLRSEGFTEDSFTLAGAPGILGLTFGDSAVTSVTSSIGIQVDTRIPLANGQTLIPFARVAWVHEFNPDRGIFASLTASPAAFFASRGASAASDVARVNAGLRLDVGRGLGLFAYFDGEFSERSQSYASTGGVRISW